MNKFAALMVLISSVALADGGGETKPNDGKYIPVGGWEYHSTQGYRSCGKSIRDFFTDVFSKPVTLEVTGTQLSINAMSGFVWDDSSHSFVLQLKDQEFGLVVFAHNKGNDLLVSFSHGIMNVASNSTCLDTWVAAL